MQGRKDPVAFVCRDDLLISCLNDTYNLVKAPPRGQKQSIRLNPCRAASSNCLRQHLWILAVCINEIYNSMCWWTEQKKRAQDRENEPFNELPESRDWSFSNALSRTIAGSGSSMSIYASPRSGKHGDFIPPSPTMANNNPSLLYVSNTLVWYEEEVRKEGTLWFECFY